jgi:hypothetical protein
MVMVRLRGSFIVRRLTGKLNLDEPPFCNESFEAAIDRRNPQTWSVHLCDLEYLLGTQRAISFFDNAPNGPALASITFHVNMVYGIRQGLQCQCRVDKVSLWSLRFFACRTPRAYH